MSAPPRLRRRILEWVYEQNEEGEFPNPNQIAVALGETRQHVHRCIMILLETGWMSDRNMITEYDKTGVYPVERKVRHRRALMVTLAGMHNMRT